MLLTSHVSSTRPIIYRHSNNLPQYGTSTRRQTPFAATTKFPRPPAGNQPNGYRLPQATKSKKPSLPANPQRTRRQTCLQLYPCPSGYRELSCKKLGIEHSTNVFDSLWAYFSTPSTRESRTCFEHSTDGGINLSFSSLLASSNYVFKRLTLLSTDEVKTKALL